ncbi:class I adenylate-forming enzyme family protein [Arthrobacter caoxuetaonis]|uniref:class I adenylate-forming enzyme family protein n=1 Tax=Arthrobacter caoxuetaonis TaxID=2886935 RepID=UPI001D13D0D5|nr:AMP-binding protein [Arthrobacter caoxuetaonis]MCC3283355.1 AMP-binding protein [Arthrobacter caoxuetaonis]
MQYDAGRFKDYFEHQMTYGAGFRRNVARYGSAVAMIDPPTGRQWTYAELGADVEACAKMLADRGVARGDRVMYQLFNGPEFALLYLATHRLGAISVPVNFRLAPGETAHILRDSQPSVFIVDADCAAAAARALEIAEMSPLVLVAGTPDGGLPGGWEDFGTALEQARLELAAAAESGDPASSALPPLPADYSTYEESTRLYTSGTTGMPKGVALPSIAELMSAHDVIMHFPLTPYDRTLNMTPWFHRGGLHSGGPNPSFYIGAGVVPLRSFHPATVLDWVGEYGLTFLIGAPTTLELIAEEQEKRPRDISTLKGIVTMGAPLDRAAALRYQELLTPRIFNGYGTTEAFWNTFLRPEDLPERAGTAGRACTDDDVAVVKVFPDRRARPDELAAQDGTEAGEMIMRSPKAGYSYVNLPGADEEKFVNGWLYPGDMATWDADGFVTILGRKDDMIISGGENIHPVQVEGVLAEHPEVLDSVVVSVPDPQWGQRVVAYVVPRSEAATADALDEFCLAHPGLANFKRPRAYRFVDSVPLTATGKKMHFKLAETAVEDLGAGNLVVPGAAVNTE